MSEKIVIDATDGVLGRIASYAAKQALLGKEVIIVNCKEAILSGRRNSIIKEYHHARKRGGSSLNGPHFPKIAERVFKRTIRGMLSYTQKRGEEALDRIMCYNALPKEYEASKKITFVKEMKISTLKLRELEKLI